MSEFVLTESEVVLMGYAERAVRRLLEQAQEETKTCQMTIFKAHNLPLDTQGRFVPLKDGKWKFVPVKPVDEASPPKGGKVTRVK